MVGSWKQALKGARLYKTKAALWYGSRRISVERKVFAVWVSVRRLAAPGLELRVSSGPRRDL